MVTIRRTIYPGADSASICDDIYDATGELIQSLKVNINRLKYPTFNSRPSYEVVLRVRDSFNKKNKYIQNCTAFFQRGRFVGFDNGNDIAWDLNRAEYYNKITRFKYRINNKWIYLTGKTAEKAINEGFFTGTYSYLYDYYKIYKETVRRKKTINMTVIARDIIIR